MKKQLFQAFSTRNLLLSSMATLLLGFSIPTCKKESDKQEDTSSVVAQKKMHEEVVVNSSEAEAYEERASNSDSSPVVIHFKNGETVTKNQIEKIASDIIAQSPYGNIKPSDLPEQIYSGLIDQVVDGEVIDYWAKDTKLYSRADFKDDVAKIIAMVKKAKASEFFAKDIKNQMKKISDSEIESYYNNNLKNYTKSAGGTTTSMVSFDSQEQAEEFLSALNSDGKANTADSMKSLQAELKVGEYKSLGRITKEMLEGEDQKASPYGFPKTNAPKAVLKFVKQAKKYPSSGTVDLENGKVAVVLCADHTEPSYYTFAEVKAHVKQIIEQERMQEEYKSKMAAMSKKYISSLDKKSLAKPKKAGRDSEADLMSQLMGGAGNASGLDDGMSDGDLQKSLAELQNMDPAELEALAESLGK